MTCCLENKFDYNVGTCLRHVSNALIGVLVSFAIINTLEPYLMGYGSNVIVLSCVEIWALFNWFCPNRYPSTLPNNSNGVASVISTW